MIVDVQAGELFKNTNGDSSLVMFKIIHYLDQHDNFPLDQLLKVSFYEKSQDMLDCLSDAMAELCPPGHYFGESRHDTGMFGFWPVPENFWEVTS